MTTCLFGQTTFHRTYGSSNQQRVHNIGGAEISGGNYLSLDVVGSLDENGIERGDSMLITVFKTKGDILWTKSLNTKDSVKFSIDYGSVVELNKDTLLVGFLLLTDTSENKVIAAFNKNGLYLGAQTLSRIANNSDDNLNSIGDLELNALDEELFYLSNRTADGSKINEGKITE